MRLLLPLLVLIPLFAQTPQDAPKKGGGGRGGPPKNLKVLKVQGPELGQLMRTYTVALGGVRCDFCHVQGQFDSDDNPKKEIARKMIVMAQEINAKFPDGKEHVTCYTCHRGDPMPKTAPPPAAPAQ
ncbi:MAG TPA: c-type cytochrome [Bryobacteraceae bacterium]|nr:c-type cytochrome [Bryobacteraceae bacterium]